jgi:diguanylate cyclase (GGDEF)-like protein
MRILVIDDDAGGRALLQLRLTELGHDVQAAGSGTEGVAMFVDYSPDLVLLDMLMPDMDGREAARRMRASREAWVPIIFLSGCTASEDIETAIAAGGDDYLLKPADLKILEAKIHAMQRIAAMREELVTQAAELAHEVEMDALTGIANRRRLDSKIADEVSRCARSGSPLSVIMLDVDHFKRFNDVYGHQTGDQCLTLVAGTLSDQLHRPSDMVARYGGEEFCVVLPETPGEGAYAIAEQLRQAVSELVLRTPQSEARITISLGIATAVPTLNAKPDKWIASADSALYEAKKAGRNTVRRAGASLATISGLAAGATSARSAANS